ncbi:MAG: DUF4062 domain-containing protein [Candidatus Cloacimonadota bacterium]|nr:DUF4062 domain-containing protein [Candidatus Cloacimonadota bacterium]
MAKKLKLMVSSTVYDSESDLDQIEAILQGFGYKVIMSKNGTVYVPADMSNEDACLKAVEECDLFLGIIFPRYGSGITHKEILKAIELDKPRWFISHHYVTFARTLFKQFMYNADKSRNEDFHYNSTSVLDKLEVIEMYNDAIQNNIPFEQRKSNWAHPFFNTSDIFPFLETQFKDIKRREKELEEISGGSDEQ